MISSGRTVRIFLADGTPSGVLTAEIINWTGKLFSCPRSSLPSLVSRRELTKTGVYILSGINPDRPSDLVTYIGESDDVVKRLLTHNRSDDMEFWTQTHAIVSKDDNITKAHGRYLESRLIKDARTANRTNLRNGTSPDGIALPESDIADMEYFLEQVGLVLPILGLDILRPVTSAPGVIDNGAAGETVFEITELGLEAIGTEENGKFVVHAGSTARKQGTASWTAYRELRETLLGAGKLTAVDDETLRFVEDVPFNSPSAAACVVVAANRNGRNSWRIRGTGQTYGAWQETRLRAAESNQEMGD